MTYIQANQIGIIEVISELQGYIQNPTLVLETVPSDFYDNISSYIVENGTLVKVSINPEKSFNAKLAIDTLFPYFINELYDKDGAVSLIMNLIQYGGAFKAIAMKIDYMYKNNQINDAGYQYFLEVFNEQNIDLLTYLL